MNIAVPKHFRHRGAGMDSTGAEALHFWEQSVKESFAQTSDPMALYVHLPFCESLCTFCACPKTITKNHDLEQPYIDALLREWTLYCSLLAERPTIGKVHLGGGTPTFFSTKNLAELVNRIFSIARCDSRCELSFDAHATTTTREHFTVLFSLGFRHVRLGVYDYALKVQRAINRIQPMSNVARATLWAREVGFTSISHDLLFGLPFQEKADVIDSLEKTLVLQPDVINFHNYNHFGWGLRQDYRGYSKEDLANHDQKSEMYQAGCKFLTENGYHQIGFALEPMTARKSKADCHGYYGMDGMANAAPQIGLGVSATGDCANIRGHNTEILEDYIQLLEWNQLPIVSCGNVRRHPLGRDSWFKD